LVSEQTRETADDIKNYIKQHGIEYRSLFDLLDVAKVAFEKENDTEWALKVTSYIKECCRWAIQKGVEVLQMDDLYWKTMKAEAPYHFESFLFYMEKNRPQRKIFYENRKKALKVVVDDLQDLEDGKIEFYGLSMPPRVGKSTICIFFYAWIIGKRPDSHNAMAGHSGLLADGFYTEILNLTTSSEYTFSEIFPDVQKESQHSDKNEVNYNTPDRFATLTCRGIDGTWTGEVDISEDGYLYVDDLVRDRKESLSPRRLENRYQDYLNILVDRKNDGSKELMVGTRWNVLDPLGRVEAENKNDPLYRFRKIPALNEKGESNFDYPVKGFSTRYYQRLKKRLDKNEWEAKYQQKPYVREGLLYPEDDLRHYNGILPEGDHRVISACDVAWGGGDSLSMPIGYEYPNGDVYITDWIFNKGKKEVTLPLVIGKLMGEEIRQICFEANNGGDMYRKYVDEKLEEYGYKCSCTDKKAPGNMEKLSKIIAYSGYIIQHFVFLEDEKQSKEYSDAMDELLMFVQIGSNEHDDAADGLTQLAMSIENLGGVKTTVIDSPMG
jgi:predicted phage terminase large subunit-like protein